jgi:hypothetical protein
MLTSITLNLQALMKHNPGTIAILALIALTSCTYTISMAHTEGTASDTIDDTSTPTADVDATATIPASVVGK